MDGPAPPAPGLLAQGKFRDPAITAKGERRAIVRLSGLQTLWFNTGTLCNLTCGHCYIESSPRNDRLAYLVARRGPGLPGRDRPLRAPTRLIGFTGGEPFMNPGLPAMLEDALAAGSLRSC